MTFWFFGSLVLWFFGSFGSLFWFLHFLRFLYFLIVRPAINKQKIVQTAKQLLANGFFILS
jgi:preprotein translocase subunit YajC